MAPNDTPDHDVLVAGGGLAGVAAAVAAARTGAHTLLVEQNGFLGGQGVMGATGWHSFFNVFDVAPGYPRARVAAGIAQELVDRIQGAGGGLGHIRMERGGDFVSMLTPVEPEVAKQQLFAICREAGVELLLHTGIDEVRTDGAGRITGLVLWNREGRAPVSAQVFVDTTGDGTVAAGAGAPFERFLPGQAGAYSAGFTFRLCNVDLQALEADLEARGLISQIAHAVKPGTCAPDLVRLGIDMRKLQAQGATGIPNYFLSSSLRPREITYMNCINYGPNDGMSAAALTEAEISLRSQMFEIAEFFRESFAGCEGCYVAGPAPSAGQRRGLAIHCDYELTQADCTGGAQFDDQIGCFSFIDNGRYFVRDGGAYGIPYRALQPKGVQNALIAGRMMTIDTVAHNSTRNTVACMVAGQAAGTAAAMAALQGIAPREVDVPALQDALRRAGALLAPRPDPL
jgi:hypothetical protein